MNILYMLICWLVLPDVFSQETLRVFDEEVTKGL